MSQAPAPPTLDPKHDADLIKARQKVQDAQAKTKTKMEEAAAALAESVAAEEAYTALWAQKLNDPETGWRPRIWALDKTVTAQTKRLGELEKLPGVKK